MNARTGIQYTILVVITAGLALAGAHWYVTSRPMAFMEAGYPVWKAKETMMANCDLGSLAVFGDSQADSAIIPALLPGVASNFGFAGGTPIEGYFFIERSLRCKTRPQHLLLSFGADALMTIRPWLWDNTVRYGLLGAAELAEVRHTAEAIRDPAYLAVKTHDGLDGRLRDVLYAAHFPSVYFSSLVEGRIYQRNDKNLARYAEILKARGYPDYGTGGGVAAPAARSQFAVQPTQKVYFEKTLEKLASAGVDVDFLMTPSSEVHLPEGQRQIIEGYTTYLSELTKRFPNFHLLQSSVPVWPNRMFGDGVHLNRAGAEKLSQLLSSCIALQTDAVGKQAPTPPCNFAVP